MKPGRYEWVRGDMSFVPLVAPPPAGFDCGSTAQNDFLYREALPSRRARISFTYLAYLHDEHFGYLTLAPDSLELLARQRPRGFKKYPRCSALKILQMAVDQRYHGRGFGKALLDIAVGVAERAVSPVPFRFITLDAVPEQVGFYQSYGFVRSELRDEERRARLAARGLDTSHLATSMHLDLTERF